MSAELTPVDPARGLTLAEFAQMLDQVGVGDAFVAHYVASDAGRLTAALMAADKSPQLGEANEVLRFLRDRRARAAADLLFEAERYGTPPPPVMGTLAELLKLPEDPPERVAGLMPWGASTAVIAARKTGKTTMGVNLAHSLITGDLFLGQFSVQPVTGRVGFLNYEMSPVQFRDWALKRGVDRDRLFVVNLRGRTNPLRSRDGRAELADVLRTQEVESLIVDPFGRAYTGQSQNDPGEVYAWLADLDMFAREEVGATDLTLMVHAGWEGEHARGASSLEDWPDALIYLTRDKRPNRFGQRARYLSADGRDVELGAHELLLDPDTNTQTLGKPKGSRAGSAQVADAVEPRDDLLVAICEELKAAGEPCSTNYIKREVSGRAEDVTAALGVLVDGGFVKAEKRGQSKLHTLVRPYVPGADEAQEDFSDAD